MRPAVPLLLVVLLAPATLRAQGSLIPRCVAPPPPCREGGCAPRPMPMPCPRPIRESAIERVRSDVHVTLADRVLRHEVTEVFVNRGGGVGEADYIFPLPANAAFQDLRLSINGELVAGETLGADEARRVYEDIVRRQRDPALVEWLGHGLLRARIFPINPGEEKKVVVRFQSVASREGDALRIDYPRGSHLTLHYPDDRRHGTAYSPTHDVEVTRDAGGRRVDVRGAGAPTILIPLRRERTPAIGVLTHARGEDDRFVLVTLSPPTATVRRTPRDVTLVLDVSGSMGGRKIAQARESARRLLETLAPGDRFRIIDFATEVHGYPATSEEGGSGTAFVEVGDRSIREAQRYISSLEASGSTNISGALAEALRSRPEGERLSLVLFMTDGEPTVGIRDARAIADSVRVWRRGRRVFAFGLGADVNVSLLEQLALEGRGTAQFLRPEEDVERSVALAASRLSTPVMTDVRLHAEGVRLRQVLPAEAVDLFAGSDVVFLARYRGDGISRITISGRTADGPVSWTTTVGFPAHEPANRFVPRLWATRRVGYLSAERRRNGPSREVDDEIRQLGEAYGIPTELTSYLVLEPGMAAGNARGGGVPAPAAEREGRFAAAKAASSQRDASSLSAVAAGGEMHDGGRMQRVGGRVFRLVDGVWTDGIARSNARVLRVRAYSDAYFALLRELPELGAWLGLGDRVRVTGRALVLEVGPDGLDTLDRADVARAARDW